MILPDEKDSIGLAVGLVNTWDVLNDPPELLREVERLQVLLRWFELDEAADSASDRDLPSVRRVRDRLHVRGLRIAVEDNEYRGRDRRCCPGRREPPHGVRHL